MVFVDFFFNTKETSVGEIQRIYDQIKPLLIEELKAKKFGMKVLASQDLEIDLENDLENVEYKERNHKKKDKPIDEATQFLKEQAKENSKIYPKTEKMRAEVVKKFKEENQPLSNFL